jgi:hypothetical protein
MVTYLMKLAEKLLTGSHVFVPGLDATALQTSVQRRRISRLWHLSRLSLVSSIFSNGGLLSRARMDASGIPYEMSSLGIVWQSRGDERIHLLYLISGFPKLGVCGRRTLPWCSCMSCLVKRSLVGAGLRARPRRLPNVAMCSSGQTSGAGTETRPYERTQPLCIYYQPNAHPSRRGSLPPFRTPVSGSRSMIWPPPKAIP